MSSSVQAAPSYAKEDLCIPLPAYHISAQAEPTKTISYANSNGVQMSPSAPSGTILCKGGPLHTITCIPLLYIPLLFLKPLQTT